HPDNRPEIVHRMRSIGRTPAHAQDKKPPAPGARLRQQLHRALNGVTIQPGNNLRRFVKILLCKAHAGTPSLQPPLYSGGVGGVLCPPAAIYLLVSSSPANDPIS